ncbi:MAG: AraC family transcriptional regulator [Clostridia bacterium]
MEKTIIKHGNHIINNDDDGYMFSYNASTGTNFNSHIHKCHEIIHIVEGEFFYNVEGKEYRLSGGDLILTKPDELHSFSFPKGCEYKREFLHIYPNFLERFPEASEILNSRQSGNLNLIPVEKVKKYNIDKIFNEMYIYCADPLPETDLMVLLCAVQMILKLNHIWFNDTPKYRDVITDAKTNSIRDYIDRHCMEDITAASVAEAVFMSQAYASRFFKEKTGMTIKTYLNMRRITNAKNLIMEGNKVTNVFARCGFKDYSTFYRAFVKYVGMTPEEFKNSHNGNKK